MAMSMVEIAAMVGLTWSRSEVNILRVSVEDSPREMKSAMTTSSNEVTKAKSAPDSTEIRICGKVTVKKAIQRLAPTLRATISWLISYRRKPAVTVTMTKGMAST